MMRFGFVVILISVFASWKVRSQSLPTHEVVPQSDFQVSFRERGMEKTRWNYDPKYTRPFFFPFNGPSGKTLTRIGHPGAPDHDHHRSVWFAHNKVNGLNFWAENVKNQVRQKEWIAYQDGDQESIMASLLGWFAEDGSEQMEQELIAAAISLPGGEFSLEFQTTFRCPRGAARVELDKTNFGFLAVRVAKSISEYFGGGTLTNSEGQVHEKDIFGKPARWMDYSGLIGTGTGEKRTAVVEGITFFDHPGNPRYPTHWHVREDGWMGAAFCLQEAFTITPEAPLVLRYLLHAHSGKYTPDRAAGMAESFAQRPGFLITEKPERHIKFGVKRAR